MDRVIPLGEVASHIGMNPSALCTFIKKHTNLTFTEFLNNIRLAKAKELLLNSELSVSEVAYKTGFSSLSYFHKIFRNHYHCTPRSLRTSKSINLSPHIIPKDK